MNKKTKRLAIEILCNLSNLFTSLILVAYLNWKGAILFVILFFTTSLYYSGKYE